MEDNTTSLITLDYVIQHKLQENIAAIVFTCVLLLIGIPGNSLVCYVYLRWKEKGSSKISKNENKHENVFGPVLLSCRSFVSSISTCQYATSESTLHVSRLGSRKVMAQRN